MSYLLTCWRCRIFGLALLLGAMPAAADTVWVISSLANPDAAAAAARDFSARTGLKVVVRPADAGGRTTYRLTVAPGDDPGDVAARLKAINIDDPWPLRRPADASVLTEVAVPDAVGTQDSELNALLDLMGETTGDFYVVASADSAGTAYDLQGQLLADFPEVLVQQKMVDGVFRHRVLVGPVGSEPDLAARLDGLGFSDAWVLRGVAYTPTMPISMGAANPAPVVIAPSPGDRPSAISDSLRSAIEQPLEEGDADRDDGYNPARLEAPRPLQRPARRKGLIRF